MDFFSNLDPITSMYLVIGIVAIFSALTPSIALYWFYVRKRIFCRIWDFLEIGLEIPNKDQNKDAEKVIIFKTPKLLKTIKFPVGTKKTTFDTLDRKYNLLTAFSSIRNRGSLELNYSKDDPNPILYKPISQKVNAHILKTLLAAEAWKNMLKRSMDKYMIFLVVAVLGALVITVVFSFYFMNQKDQLISELYRRLLEGNQTSPFVG